VHPSRFCSLLARPAPDPRLESQHGRCLDVLWTIIRIIESAMPSDTQAQSDGAPLLRKPPGYHSYLLRFWEERSDELPTAVWRFSLEDPLTDQRYGFASFEALTDWLKTKMAAPEA
jgi:hypothetical protein